ncbi:unnamed protein product [Adineta ricciae]|uniref:Fanconi-associated nuclease n=2 Tax=Adineta ricciae TaxID=249248 RepID=A0A815C342_ADIRI|nr:unnamed protein product [Adineta ricciae]
MRRCKWIRRSTINYEIPDLANDADNLTPLVANGLVQDISSLDDLDGGLRLLSSDEMRDFSKRFHCQSKTSKSKKTSIENLKSLTNQYKSVFGSSTTTNRDHLLLKELKRILNNCYKISEDIRGLFFRMMLTYHPVALLAMDDLDQNGFTLLYKTLQIIRGQIRLPWNEEQISHEHLPFKTPEQLQVYQAAIDLEMEYNQLEQAKKTDNLVEFYEKYNEQWRAMIDSSPVDEQLPGYFRRFSPDYVRARILSSLTEVLQRARRYEQAIELIQYLLNRTMYNRHRRGKLWNRLALIQENYIKIHGHQQCLDTIYEALKDPYVKLGDRLALCERARKLMARPKSKETLVATWMADEEEKLMWNIPMPKEVDVTGRLLANDARMGKVTYTIQDPVDGSIQFCTVEQLAIHHYRIQEDYTFGKRPSPLVLECMLDLDVKGIHSEGAVIRTVVGLLFLDLIYTLPTPDLLIDIFQTEPLDFQTDSFYKSRQMEIDQRISYLNCEENIQEIAEKNWDMYNLTMSTVVNWELFQTKLTLLDALKCLTPEQIQSISTYTFVHNRAVWKGFPDLFVWNPITKKCKFVEVKSHNDRLSFHQIVWLDKLVEFQIDCEVCKVGEKKMFANDDEDEEWNQEDENEEDQPQGYEALLDPDDEGSFAIEDDEPEEDDQEELEQAESIEQETPVDDGQIKPFMCKLCSTSFSKFEGYREHFVSTEHRYKRRDEKKRLGEGGVIETPPVEVFVNLLLYNKTPFESVQIVVQLVDFSMSGTLEYNQNKYEYQHAVSYDELYQNLVNQFNQDYEKYRFKMPPQSFFVARDICRKEVDHVWTVPRYCDDTGKSDEQIVKEVLDFCVYTNVEPERERLIGHSIQTWRMFHRQESKPGFWCDICKQCFRKRKAILCHFESSEKHEKNLKHLPPYRRAVQHSLFTGRLLNEFIELEKVNYYRNRVNAYRIPPSIKSLKNAYYCTFCKKSFESTHSLEKHLGWKNHRDILRKRRQNDQDNIPRLATYLNFNQLSHEQRNGGIQQMPKIPEEYRMKYNLEPITVENMQEDIKRFDTQLAQQVMQNIYNQQGNNNNNNNQFNRGGGRGRGRGRQTFRGQGYRPRGNFHQQNPSQFNQGEFNRAVNYQPRSFNNNQQFYPQNNFYLPNTFRPQNQQFVNGNNKRTYQQNNNYYNPRQSWQNKRPRFDRPPTYQPPPSSSSNRIDYRYVANQNTYQHQQQFQ